MTYSAFIPSIQPGSNAYPIGPDSPAPAGFEVVHRSAIVRLGPDLSIHNLTNHCSVGVDGIDVDEDRDTLRVHTDWDGAREKAMTANVHMDNTLAAKGVQSGASGGASITSFPLTSVKPMAFPNSDGTTRWVPVGTVLHPKSAVFNSTIDNLWIEFRSLRAL